MNPKELQIHEKYIRRCFELARKGKRRTAPNPLVGAVIVKNSKIIGEGYHEYFGGPHAEVNAFNNCTEDPAGSDVYVNLEPCSHTNKKTPPCTPLVISKNVKRLIISNLDPNPEVNGNGIKMIREAGIEVITGILKDEGEELNKFFFKYAANKEPYVTLKIATSADGYITAKAGTQTWITGYETKEYVHSLRSNYQAVIAGANTVKIDNPLLTVRLVEGDNPLRVIIDGKLSSPLDAKVFECNQSNKTIVFTHSDNISKIKKLEEKGVQLVRLKAKSNGLLNLKTILKILGELNISSVLVEGGASINTQFLKNNLADEIQLIKSKKKLWHGVKAYSLNLEFDEPVATVKLGEDELKIYYNYKVKK